MKRKHLIPGTIIFLAVVVAVLLELRPGSEEPAPVALIRTDNNGAAGGPLEQSEAGVPAKSAERERPEPSKGWLLAEGIERHFPASSVLVTKATHRLVEKDSFGRTVEEWEIQSYCHDNSLDRFTEINTREGIVEFFATLHQETGDVSFAVPPHGNLVVNLLAWENKDYSPEALEGAGQDTQRFPFGSKLTVTKRIGLPAAREP